MPNPTLTRRDVVSLAASTAAAAALPGCETPAPGDTVSGDTAVTPATIDHIVVVMMENRSFDHYLGARKLLEGEASDGLTADMSNRDSAGVDHPVHAAKVDCLYDPPHSWDSSHRQWNEGLNDGFVTEYEGAPEVGEVMGYMTREDLPITWALADAYAVCDRYFCSVMGPTWPNRFYGLAGTSDGQTNNAFPEGGAFTFPTVFDKLEEKGVAWKYYYSDLPVLGLFSIGLKDGRWGFVEDFVWDCEHGQLPAVSWVDPGFGFNDDHPPHHPGMGQAFLKVVYEALAASPHWERCLLVITYDEHGGFFDHVSPPQVEDDHADRGFNQLGFRIPVVVIGPYVRPGVHSTQFDNTSWLKMVCDRWGLDPWTTRIRTANSLAAVLDEEAMAAARPNAPAAVPAFTFDESHLPEECTGNGVFGPPPPEDAATAQPELTAFLQAHRPGTIRASSARSAWRALVRS